jgi:hypothetical protein
MDTPAARSDRTRSSISRRRFVERTACTIITLAGLPTHSEARSLMPTPSRSRPGPRGGPYAANRDPLVPQHFVPLPLGAVKPGGWLRAQLTGWAQGMTGNLDTLWADVGPENGWLGGGGDAWERGPYWVDGLLPLAWLVGDERLIAKSTRWVEAALASRRPNGFFGPDVDRPQGGGRRPMPGADWWPRMVMLKVLQQHHDVTGDPRVLELLHDYFQFQLRELPAKPLGHYTFWGAERGGENLASVHWLYNRTGDGWLLDLGELVFRQTVDWTGRFTGAYDAWHGVNTAMGVKQPGVWYAQSGQARYLDAVEAGLKHLMTAHGQVQGMFSGDEMLHGTDPSHGIETCAVVEYLHSLETLLPITGRVDHADRIERVAYNALPAALSPHFAGRHYYQSPNEIACTRGYRNFSTPYADATMVGLRTGYPCCTANLHQGWPKLVAHLWMATPDGGLAALVYGPCEVRARVADGVAVRFTEDTTYPFEETVRLAYDGPADTTFPLQLRIPTWAVDAAVTVNGQALPAPAPAPGTMLTVERAWRAGDRVELTLPMPLRVSRWHDQSAGIERGPLVFALQRRERWTAVGGSAPYADYEVTSDEPWNYGVLEKDLAAGAAAFALERGPVPDQPWTPEAAPMVLRARARRIPEWQPYGPSAGPLPWRPGSSGAPDEDVTLVPYGCTKIRIAEFPTIG